MANSATITIGTAYKITIDNFYDLLRKETGGWDNKTLFQLNLHSNTIDLSENYEAFSYENIRRVADVQIVDSPLSDLSIQTAQFSRIWGEFLFELFKLTPELKLTEEDKQKLIDLEADNKKLKQEVNDLEEEENRNWNSHCENNGLNKDDLDLRANYFMSDQGQGQEINDLYSKIDNNIGETNMIEISGSTENDRNIRIAWNNYSSVRYKQLLCLSPKKLTVADCNDKYIKQASKDFSFDYSYPIDKSLNTIKTSQANKLITHFDQTTENTSTISTSFGGDGNVGYSIFKIETHVEDVKTISDEFSKVQAIDINSESIMKIGINYTNWFDASLFKSGYIINNPDIFNKFLGPDGSLVYYPISLIILRGITLVFTSSQKWNYNYKENFRASAGGGMNFFGISFGGNEQYTNETKEHIVDANSTTLSISDDKNTIRLVGYEIANNRDIQKKLSLQTKNKI